MPPVSLQPSKGAYSILTENPKSKGHEVLVHALYFAQLREMIGRSEEDLSLIQGTTLKQLFTQLSLQAPRLNGFEDSIVFFRNDERAIGSELLRDGDKVAFCPPVSGG